MVNRPDTGMVLNVQLGGGGGGVVVVVWYCGVPYSGWI